MPFFRVSFFSINSWTEYENWSEIPKRVMAICSRTKGYCFKMQGIKMQFFFLNGLWRLLKNGHLPVRLHSSAPRAFRIHYRWLRLYLMWKHFCPWKPQNDILPNFTLSPKIPRKFSCYLKCKVGKRVVNLRRQWHILVWSRSSPPPPGFLQP